MTCGIPDGCPDRPRGVLHRAADTGAHVSDDPRGTNRLLNCKRREFDKPAVPDRSMELTQHFVHGVDYCLRLVNWIWCPDPLMIR